jgi:hypothetical protein
MADVFLSYSSKDRAAAERVQQALERAGISVFWDQETPAGADWDTWIREKLTGSKAAVVLWSKESIKSPNVRHEAIVARDAGKLVPVMIETLSPSDFPMGLYLVQGVQLQDWRNSSSGGMARLISEVELRLGRGAGAGRAPPKNLGRIKSVKKPSPVPLVLAGLVVAAVLGGAAWMLTRDDVPDRPDTPTETATAATAAPGPYCLDGSTPDAQGMCANGNRPIPPAPALGGSATAADGFSRRMLGHWNWDGLACAEGPNVTLEGGRLVFTTPKSRHVHEIVADGALETSTRVLECRGCDPGDVDDRYVLSIQPVATADLRNFELIVANVTDAKKDVWSPCEVN